MKMSIARAVGIWLIATLWVSGAVLAAAVAKTKAPVPPPAASEEDEELDEVLVEGRRLVKQPAKVREWITRLQGQFVVDGTVVLHAKVAPNAPLAVQGRSNCVIYPTPAVQCDLQVNWPLTTGADGSKMLGGVSKLDPAVLLYAYDTDRARVRHMLVDSDGIAESAVGFLYDDDTLVTRNKCVNVPGNCERVARITAAPDLKQVEMRIDVEVEFQRVVSYQFVLHRTSEAPAAHSP